MLTAARRAGLLILRRGVAGPRDKESESSVTLTQRAGDASDRRLARSAAEAADATGDEASIAVTDAAVVTVVAVEEGEGATSSMGKAGSRCGLLRPLEPLELRPDRGRDAKLLLRHGGVGGCRFSVSAGVENVT